MTRRPIGSDQALAALAQIPLAEVNLGGVIEKVAELTRDSLKNADQVSVTLVRAGRAHTAAFTGDTAVALDETQYEQGQGPCLAAAATVTTVYIPNMHNEARWPAFTARAVERGVASSLSVGMPVHGGPCAGLNIYATTSDAFDDDDITIADSFAVHAAVALANADLYDGVATLAEQMREAMAGRAVIEQAKGIIMAKRRCSADEAFTILARTSQEMNRKVRDIAAVFVEDAQRPRP